MTSIHRASRDAVIEIAGAARALFDRPSTVAPALRPAAE
jgi:hypothetical protein